MSNRFVLVATTVVSIATAASVAQAYPIVPLNPIVTACVADGGTLEECSILSPFFGAPIAPGTAPTYDLTQSPEECNRIAAIQRDAAVRAHSQCVLNAGAFCDFGGTVDPTCYQAAIDVCFANQTQQLSAIEAARVQCLRDSSNVVPVFGDQ